MSKKYKNSVVIDGESVVKKRNDEVLELYDYLLLSGFDNFPSVIEVLDDSVRSKYIKSEKYREVASGTSIIETMAKLHSKTVFYKDISSNKHKEVKEKIEGNILYLKDYYENLMDSIEGEVYMSPSHYLLARNYSVILGSLKYAEENIKKWMNIVKDKTTERVCIVHNNIKKEHFIRGDKNYLISWEKHLVDTPILDLYKYYKSDGYKLNFDILFKTYKNNFELLKEEELLFKILISIPPKMVLSGSEVEKTIYVKDSLKYIYESYKIVKE